MKSIFLVFNNCGKPEAIFEKTQRFEEKTEEAKAKGRRVVRGNQEV